MSDIDMDVSPRSETGSDHSEIENPPTPGSYGEEDVEVKSDKKQSYQEQNNELNASYEEVPEEHDLSDEDSEENDEPISPISPVAPISPISPNNIPSDNEEESKMDVDQDLGNTEQEDVTEQNNAGEQGDNDEQDDIQKESTTEEVHNDEQESDAEEGNDIERGTENDNLEEKRSAENSQNENYTQSNEENLDDLNKKETVNIVDELEATGKQEMSPLHEEETSSPNVKAIEGPESPENEDKENENKEVSSRKNDSLEENDLMNITEISDLSVDLTGDEEAIVEDILQNVGDGELLPDEQSEEKPVEDQDEVSEEKSSKTAKDNEDNEEQAGGTGELINDIFGSSDEDDEDFAGFEDDELHGTTKVKKKTKTKHEKKAIISDDEGEGEVEKTETETKATGEESLTVPPPEDSDSEDEDAERKSEVFVYDFDLMMQQKKEENRKTHRRRKNIDIINDNDDLVAGIIKRMQEAAQEDRLANEAKQAATKKLKLLPAVLKHMLKIDLMVVFVDSNVLPVLKEWISPLPDGSLPHIQIREGILKILEQLPPVDSGALKVSGIGKAIMYLFRHPKETRKNKERAGKIISEWSRPIFGVTANFKSMSREEREDRDYANMSKRRRISSDGVDGGKTPKRIENAIKSDSKALRPGDKGWCMRARVPAPSNKDYVVRPKSNIEYVDFTKTPKKTLNRFEKQKRKLNERKAGAKQRAVEISLEGRKMAL